MTETRSELVVYRDDDCLRHGPRRAEEAERAVLEERDDLRPLTDIGRERPDGGDP